MSLYRDAIRAELDASGEMDPHKLNLRTAKSLSDMDCRTALEECGVAVAHAVIYDERKRALRDMADETPPAGRTRSKKWDAAGTAYARYLATSVCIAHGIHKAIGDCTGEDLSAAAQIRRNHAAGVLAEADRLDRLIAALDAHGAATPRDLAPAVLMEAVQ